VRTRHPAAQVRRVGLVHREIPRPLLEAEPMRRERDQGHRESRQELQPVQFVRA
jgi:hypothetical protein